jgi:hypothetical protein
MGLIGVPSVFIDDFAFKPGSYVHYQESVHPIADGLPKFRDLPQEAGGSGETLDGFSAERSNAAETAVAE